MLLSNLTWEEFVVSVVDNWFNQLQYLNYISGEINSGYGEGHRQLKIEYVCLGCFFFRCTEWSWRIALPQTAVVRVWPFVTPIVAGVLEQASVLTKLPVEQSGSLIRPLTLSNPYYIIFQLLL